MQTGNIWNFSTVVSFFVFAVVLSSCTTTQSRSPKIVIEKPSSGDTRTPTNQALRAVQLKLNQGGFNSGIPDGVYGAKTKAAISRFQSQAGIAPADGKYSPKLLQQINTYLVSRNGGSGRKNKSIDVAKQSTNNVNVREARLIRECDSKKLASCYHLAKAYENGSRSSEGIIAANSEKSLLAFGKACDLQPSAEGWSDQGLARTSCLSAGRGPDGSEFVSVILTDDSTLNVYSGQIESRNELRDIIWVCNEFVQKRGSEPWLKYGVTQVLEFGEGWMRWLTAANDYSADPDYTEYLTEQRQQGSFRYKVSFGYDDRKSGNIKIYGIDSSDGLFEIRMSKEFDTSDAVLQTHLRKCSKNAPLSHFTTAQWDDLQRVRVIENLARIQKREAVERARNAENERIRNTPTDLPIDEGLSAPVF